MSVDRNMQGNDKKTEYIFCTTNAARQIHPSVYRLPISNLMQSTKLNC